MLYSDNEGYKRNFTGISISYYWFPFALYMRGFTLFFFLIFIVGQQVQAQTSSLAIGEWQAHLPNNRAKAIAEADEKVYCATEDGFFLYDKAFNQLQSLSRANGFHDTGISTLGYDPETKTLLIAYENTNLDLMQEGEIINLDAILRKNIPGEKQIYHVNFHHKLAYLACSFGVVVLDLSKLEIKETYSNLSPGGQPLPVYASAVLNDSLYLATATGVLAARTQNNNLLDYRNWRTFTPANGLPAATTDNFRTIAAFQNKIFVGINNQAVYRYNGQRWTETQINLENKVIYNLKAFAADLWVIDNERVRLLDKNNQVKEKTLPDLAQPRDAFPETETIFWLADYGKGLVKMTNTQPEYLVPNGPAIATPFRLYAAADKVLVLGGGYDGSYAPKNQITGFSMHQSGQWENYNAQQYSNPVQFPLMPDLVDIVRNPLNGKLYFGSYGSGLLEWEGLGKFKLYNSSNSPLVSAIPTKEGNTRVAGVAADAAGDIWVTNRSYPQNGAGLHVLRANGTWQSFSLAGLAERNNLEKIRIDANGYKWITVAQTGNNGRGIVVFDDQKEQYRHLTSQAQQGNLPGNNVYALAVDKDGLVWVGTDKGIAVFDEPERIFDGVAATIPLMDGRPLLENQVITTLAVDGGNRKWVGTETGVWLFSPDGEAVVSHFTTENSPLLANKIVDIAVNNSTGEVFIATEAGLNSYRGAATETAGKPACAMVFPNPVRPGYTGLVGISGLPNQAQVKITDITGTLVFQTQATGGTVAWDLKDIKGKRVKTGVYLAFSATADGKQTCISKIAVVE